MSKNNPSFNKRSQRVRSALKKKANGKPRLSVFRSNLHIYAQLINDAEGVTIASASTLDKDIKGQIKSTSDLEAAQAVGSLLAKRAVALKVTDVVFDRGGYIYHGRVKALADAARASGLKF